MADAKIKVGEQEIILEDIEFLPGADPYSHEEVCKHFFWGWTGKTPWGDITWRLIHPNDFPKAEVWNGQLMLGARLVVVDGTSYRLDAVASQVDNKWVVRGSADDPKNNWWLFPMQSSVTEKELEKAQETLRPALEEGCKEIIETTDHDEALLWASAYAWALQNTRRTFNQLYNSNRDAARTRGEVRDEIEAALFRAEWSRDEILSMTKHPRKEIRALATRIVMKLAEQKALRNQEISTKPESGGQGVEAPGGEIKPTGRSI